MAWIKNGRVKYGRVKNGSGQKWTSQIWPITEFKLGLETETWQDLASIFGSMIGREDIMGWYLESQIAIFFKIWIYTCLKIGRNNKYYEPRVYFSYDFFLPSGGTCNLAGIGASILNFGPAWPADVYAAET